MLGFVGMFILSEKPGELEGFALRGRLLTVGV